MAERRDEIARKLKLNLVPLQFKEEKIIVLQVKRENSWGKQKKQSHQKQKGEKKLPLKIPKERQSFEKKKSLIAATTKNPDDAKGKRGGKVEMGGDKWIRTQHVWR